MKAGQVGENVLTKAHLNTAFLVDVIDRLNPAGDAAAFGADGDAIGFEEQAYPPSLKAFSSVLEIAIGRLWVGAAELCKLGCGDAVQHLIGNGFIAAYLTNRRENYALLGNAQAVRRLNDVIRFHDELTVLIHDAPCIWDYPRLVL